METKKQEIDKQVDAGDGTRPPTWLVPDRAYEVLKWLGLIVFPAAASLVLAFGDAWGLPDAGAVAATVTAVGTFIGAVLGASALRGPR